MNNNGTVAMETGVKRITGKVRVKRGTFYS